MYEVMRYVKHNRLRQTACNCSQGTTRLSTNRLETGILPNYARASVHKSHRTNYASATKTIIARKPNINYLLWNKYYLCSKCSWSVTEGGVHNCRWSLSSL